MAKKAPTAKQKAAQARLSKASKQASREGKKGKAFRARIKQLLKGTGGGGKSKSKAKPKGGSKSRGGSTAKGNPNSKRNPKIGANYTMTKRGLKVIAPLTSIILEKAKVKNRTGDRKILSQNTLVRVGRKVNTIDYGLNVAVEVLDTIADKKFAEAGALTRGSVSAWLPEVFTGLVVLDADPGGDVTVDRAWQMHRTGVETQNGYDVIADKWEGFDNDNFKNYRLLKHGGQIFRRIANNTGFGNRITRPMKQWLKEFDLAI